MKLYKFKVEEHLKDMESIKVFLHEALQTNDDDYIKKCISVCFKCLTNNN